MRLRSWGEATPHCRNCQRITVRCAAGDRPSIFLTGCKSVLTTHRTNGVDRLPKVCMCDKTRVKYFLRARRFYLGVAAERRQSGVRRQRRWRYGASLLTWRGESWAGTAVGFRGRECRREGQQWTNRWDPEPQKSRNANRTGRSGARRLRRLEVRRSRAESAIETRSPRTGLGAQLGQATARSFDVSPCLGSYGFEPRLPLRLQFGKRHSGARSPLFSRWKEACRVCGNGISVGRGARVDRRAGPQVRLLPVPPVSRISNERMVL